MIHIYQIESECYEIYKTIIGEGWEEQYCRTLENSYELDLYLDILRAEGLDFVLHTLEEYDEYHVSLPSVQAS